MVDDPAFAKDNAPNGYSTHYMRGYGFNIPDSFKKVSDGYDNVNHLNYMNYKKAQNL